MEKTVMEKKIEQIAESLSSEEKDLLYRKLWTPYVKQDISDMMATECRIRKIQVNDKCIENEAERLAKRYVYDGEYDCNLSYWDNLGYLMEESLRNLEKGVYAKEKESEIYRK